MNVRSGLASVCLLGVACGGAPRPKAPDATVPLAANLRVRPLRPEFWLHVSENRQGIDANGLLARVGGEVVLVDAPWTDEQTDRLVVWARENLGPVTTAVVTHSHADRSGGVGALRRRGIRTLALDLTAEKVPGGKASLEAVLSPSRPVHADPRGFEVFYPGPGHVVDNVVVWFPEARLLHGGCLVKAEEAADLGYVAEADVARWPSAIEALRSRYPGVDVLVPGHGAVGGPRALERTLELLRTPKARTSAPALSAAAKP